MKIVPISSLNWGRSPSLEHYISPSFCTRDLKATQWPNEHVPFGPSATRSRPNPSISKIFLILLGMRKPAGEEGGKGSRRISTAVWELLLVGENVAVSFPFVVRLIGKWEERLLPDGGRALGRAGAGEKRVIWWGNIDVVTLFSCVRVCVCVPALRWACL